MNADGTNVRQLTTLDGGKNWPTVSPDGRKIAFGVGDLVAGNSTSIYTMNSDGTELTQLTYASGWNYKPSWSPEGKRLAFVSTRGGSRRTRARAHFRGRVAHTRRFSSPATRPG